MDSRACLPYGPGLLPLMSKLESNNDLPSGALSAVAARFMAEERSDSDCGFGFGRPYASLSSSVIHQGCSRDCVDCLSVLDVGFPSLNRLISEAACDSSSISNSNFITILIMRNHREESLELKNARFSTQFIKISIHNDGDEVVSRTYLSHCLSHSWMVACHLRLFSGLRTQ